MYTTSDLTLLHNRLTCQRQRVLFTFWSALVTNRCFCLSRTHNEWISNAWLPIYAVRSGTCGGDSADVRLRELRNIHKVPFITSVLNGKTYPCKIHHWKSVKGKITWIYRLDMKPNDIDWDDLLKNWPNWIYHKINLFE